MLARLASSARSWLFSFRSRSICPRKSVTARSLSAGSSVTTSVCSWDSDFSATTLARAWRMILARSSLVIVITTP
jgi:hypothetical protein